jgi:hypothetical protein
MKPQSAPGSVLSVGQTKKTAVPPEKPARNWVIILLTTGLVLGFIIILLVVVGGVAVRLLAWQATSIISNGVLTKVDFRPTQLDQPNPLIPSPSQTARPNSSPTPSPSPSPNPLPTIKTPFQNSLGMKFVPAGTPGVLFSVYDTRVKDFQAFVDDTS